MVMKHSSCIFLLTLLPFFGGQIAYAENSDEGKEKKETTERIDLKQIEKDVIVKALKGEILITVARPVQVKVFNILGQLVRDESIPAGSTRIQMSAHGVYIVKAGEHTSKVAV